MFYPFLKCKEGDLAGQYEDQDFDGDLCYLMSLTDLLNQSVTLESNCQSAL